MIPFSSAPSLALSDTFGDSPCYCSEMDKNNMLMRPAGVSSGEVSGAVGSGGVRLAPQTQEDSTVSHSRGEGGCQGWTLVFPLSDPHLQPRLLITGAEPSQLTPPL